MDWVESQSVRGLCPKFAEIFVRHEAFESLESAGEAVGCDEVGQVRFEFLVCVIEVTLHCGFLDRPVHAFDLPVWSKNGWAWSAGVRCRAANRPCEMGVRESAPLALGGSWAGQRAGCRCR